MAIESPLSIGAISRMPDAKTQTAAFLVLMSLALWIESPVIDLLSTSTTLSNSAQAYRRLRKFTLLLMAWVTITHALVAFTPVFWFVTLELLHLDREVAEAARLGMMVATPWSAFIGWRRFLQGILIRNGQTKLISRGTVLRGIGMAATVIWLAISSPLQGCTVAAIGLVVSVAVEAIYVHWVSRPLVRSILEAPEASVEALSMRELLGFHLPLTATTMVMMLGMPILSAALARVPNPVQMLASWQVAFTLLWLLRTIVFALPEVVVTLAKDRASMMKLRNFTLGVGLGCSLLTLFFGLTGLDRLYFRHVIGASELSIEYAHQGLMLCAALPFLNAGMSYLRGMLMLAKNSTARLWAMVFGLGILVLVLSVGVGMGGSGMVVAAAGLIAWAAAECGVLWLGHRRNPVSWPSSQPR